MIPVINRAGVTSNAGLCTAVSTKAIEVAPAGKRTSSPCRSSMGIALPSLRLQSMVGYGTAA